MLAKLYSVAISGVDARIVEVELDLAPGMPAWRVVGLPDKSVQEAGDRVRAAIKNTDYEIRARKILINLAPADLPKEGAIFDLPIALAIFAADEQISAEVAERYLIVGELALDGSVRPVRGVLAAAITAEQRGFKGVIVPRDNAREAMALADRLEIVPVARLEEAVRFLAGEIPAPPPPDADPADAQDDAPAPDFAEVRGQHHVKRALEVAAAGSHNLLLMGPPGSGKTMCAQRLPTILPPLTPAESLETTKIWSVAGELPPGRGLITVRPFRNPHHSVSAPGLIGGGSFPRPGEASLAHNGVLFLDEAPEFSRPILETLRQPLEDGRVTISRASSTQTFPARLMLALSMNLCPCGRRGDLRKTCRCTPQQVAQYVGKLSGPLLDRIDLHVEVPAVAYRDLRGDAGEGESSASIRARVLSARAIQAARYPGRSSPVNASMSPSDLRAHCALDRETEALLRQAMTEFGLSARAHARILKVARTVADLSGGGMIDAAALSEAIQYRTIDRRDAY